MAWTPIGKTGSAIKFADGNAVLGTVLERPNEDCIFISTPATGYPPYDWSLPGTVPDDVVLPQPRWRIPAVANPPIVSGNSWVFPIKTLTGPARYAILTRYPVDPRFTLFDTTVRIEGGYIENNTPLGPCGSSGQPFDVDVFATPNPYPNNEIFPAAPVPCDDLALIGVPCGPGQVCIGGICRDPDPGGSGGGPGTSCPFDTYTHVYTAYLLVDLGEGLTTYWFQEVLVDASNPSNVLVGVRRFVDLKTSLGYTRYRWTDSRTVFRHEPEIGVSALSSTRSAQQRGTGSGEYGILVIYKEMVAEGFDTDDYRSVALSLLGDFVVEKIEDWPKVTTHSWVSPTLVAPAPSRIKLRIPTTVYIGEAPRVYAQTLTGNWYPLERVGEEYRTPDHVDWYDKTLIRVDGEVLLEWLEYDWQQVPPEQPPPPPPPAPLITLRLLGRTDPYPLRVNFANDAVIRNDPRNYGPPFEYAFGPLFASRDWNTPLAADSVIRKGTWLIWLNFLQDQKEKVRTGMYTLETLQNPFPFFGTWGRLLTVRLPEQYPAGGIPFGHPSYGTVLWVGFSPVEIDTNQMLMPTYDILNMKVRVYRYEAPNGWVELPAGAPLTGVYNVMILSREGTLE